MDYGRRELRNLNRRETLISIHEDKDLTSRRLKSSPARSPVPPKVFAYHSRSTVLCNNGCPISASIVNDNDLIYSFFRNRGQKTGQRFFFVERWNDHRNLHLNNKQLGVS